MKVALVYDRVNKWGGAERVLLDLHKIFPAAQLFTSVYDPKQADWAKIFPAVHTSALNKISFIRSKHEYLAPLMPFAFESFNFNDFDLVISVTSEFAKSVITKPGTLHICYCLTPTRYLWSGYNKYFNSKWQQNLSSPLVNYLRQYDVLSAQRPDHVIAISSEVSKRIKKYYGRSSEIIFPPLSSELAKIKPKISKNSKQYFLLVSRLVKYKNVDLAIKSFNKTNYELKIVGTGNQEQHLKNIADKNIKFLGKISDKHLASLYANCQALIFPQHEDFGLVAVEAQSFGKPVIALKSGGALDTIVDGRSGLFFNKSDISSLRSTLSRFEKTKFSRQYIINNSKKFSFEFFKKNILNYISQRL